MLIDLGSDFDKFVYFEEPNCPIIELCLRLRDIWQMDIWQTDIWQTVRRSERRPPTVCPDPPAPTCPGVKH